MNLLSRTYVHTVQVQTFNGSGSYGDDYSPVVSVPCWVEESAELVQGTEGQAVNASAKVFADVDKLPLFKAGSKVTLPSGRDSWVITTELFDSGALRLPLDHIEALIS